MQNSVIAPKVNMKVLTRKRGRGLKKPKPFFKIRSSRFKKLSIRIKKFRKIRYALNIKIHSNNIFCSFRKLKNKKMLFILSSGLTKIKTSRKRLPYSLKQMLHLCIGKIKPILKKRNSLLLNLTAPKKIKATHIKAHYKNKALIKTSY
jgi:hypothetical protein